VGGLAFFIAFGEPLARLVMDWWSVPEASHGLLLAPVAVWLAWKQGVVKDPVAQPRLGLALLVAAVVLRFAAGLAAELFTMRLSMFMAVAGLVIYRLGVRQILKWWLSGALLLLSIPLPEVVLGTLALPLQLKASQWGAALLKMRNVPVLLSGNVLRLPERTLFVTEACSGLRSLTALLSLGLLIGGLWLRTPLARAVLALAALPVAMVLNAVRIFLTGFLVHFVNPALAEGLLHYTEGWVIFVVAFGILALLAWTLTRAEAYLRPAT
jgi:exosortase